MLQSRGGQFTLTSSTTTQRCRQQWCDNVTLPRYVADQLPGFDVHGIVGLKLDNCLVGPWFEHLILVEPFLGLLQRMTHAARQTVCGREQWHHSCTDIRWQGDRFLATLLWESDQDYRELRRQAQVIHPPAEPQTATYSPERETPTGWVQGNTWRFIT